MPTSRWLRDQSRKLVLDFPIGLVLAPAMESDENLEERRRLVAGLFFVLSARLQAAVQMAEEGQALSRSVSANLDLAHRVHAVAREITILADATAALLENSR